MKIQVFPLTPFMTNCYVLSDSTEAIIVDPGEPSPQVLEAVDGLAVRAIVNTHCHCDHAGGNAGLKAATGAPICCHADDVPLLEAIAAQGRMFGVPVESSPEPDRLLEEGDTVTFGAATLEVLHTPGHSPGHIVLVGEGMVLAGDVLFAGSIGRTDLPGGSYEQLLASISTKLLTLPNETVVYCGHGPETTIGEERMTNPFLAGLA